MRIEIVIFDGYDELDAFGPFELLSLAARQGAPFEVALVGVDGAGEIRGNHGSRVVVESGLGTPDRVTVPGGVAVPDAVIVPGGGWLDRAPAGAWTEAERGVLTGRLAALAPGLRWTASVCTGAMLLEAAGLLKGRTATTNSHAQDELRATGVTVLPNRVVDDGNVITSGSLSAGLDLALWIIEREADRELALAIADIVEYLPRDDVWARPLPSPTS